MVRWNLAASVAGRQRNHQDSVMRRSTKAALWIVTSCLLFGAMNAIAKLLLVPAPSGALHPLQVTFARYFFAAATLVPFALNGLKLPSGVMIGRYTVRVVAGYLGVVLMFFAIKSLRLSDATAIGFSSPFFAIAASIWILGERPNPGRWLAAIIGFIGVLVIAQPTGGSFEPAAAIALLAAFAMGVEIVGVKWLSEVDRPAIVILLSNILAVPLAAIAAVPVWVWPSDAQWAILAAIGIVAAIGQQCVLCGARLATASFIAPFFYFSLVFATLFGAFIFDEVPPLTTVIGSTIIFVGAIFPAEVHWAFFRRRRGPLHGDGLLPDEEETP